MGAALRRALEDDEVPASVGAIVLGAVDGDEALAAALDGSATPVVEHPPAPALVLRSATVEGIRGIAAPVRLALGDGPGLTLVLGGSGAGKSSFVEGLELALAGQRRTRNRRASAPGDDWRNRDHPSPAVRLELVDRLTGEASEIRATWGEGTEAGDLDLGVDGGLDATWLARAARRYRPILSLRQERVADAVDHLAGVLGLPALAAAEKRLRSARAEARRPVDKARQAAHRLADRCAALDDDRARRAAELLRQERWDLAALTALTAPMMDRTGGAADRLRPLVDVAVPDAAAAGRAASALRAAAAAMAALEGVDPVAARRRAALLEAASGHVEGPGPCPVCQQGELHADWPAAARDEAVALRREAFLAESARRELDAAMATALDVLLAPPIDPADAAVLGADVVDALTRWRVWATPPADVGELADRLDDTGAVVDDAVGARESAVQALGGVEHRWLPLARKLTGWLATSEQWQAALATLDDVVAAEAWLTASRRRIERASIDPVHAQLRRLWEELGARADVPLPLPGGPSSPGPGVLSQGERHALALSLFLPRATLATSPFRFLVIDDAAQALDADRIVALARVLAEVAETHQVLAFTRDERLVTAVEQAHPQARVLSLRAEAGGDVTLHEVDGAPVA